MPDNVDTLSSRPQLASLVDRTFASILDAMLVLPLGVLGTLLIAASTGASATNGEVELQGGSAVSAIFLFAAVWLTYHAVSEVGFGATLGKQMMSIEVTSTRSATLTPSQAVLRNLIRPLDALGFYALGFVSAVTSKRHQRFGDRIARTVVVKKMGSHRNRASIIWSICSGTLVWTDVLIIRRMH
jgi:uncharacterized RDD family membrane protein YckC